MQIGRTTRPIGQPKKYDGMLLAARASSSTFNCITAATGASNVSRRARLGYLAALLGETGDEAQAIASLKATGRRLKRLSPFVHTRIEDSGR